MTRLLLVAAALVTIGAGLIGGLALYRTHQSRDIRGSSTVEFVAQEPVSRGAERGIVWPTFGYDAARLRAPGFRLRPPFRERWLFRARHLVEFPPVIAYGRLYFTNNPGVLYALEAGTGKRVWRAGAQERLGSRGRFSSTPAVAYGRVYIGGTDGKVYSFGATSGKVRWSHDTGDFVYSSPAVWRRRVFIGSYSGEFYAFDAATGKVDWRFRANGPISGSPTVIDGVVYFATLEERTYAVDARSGKQLWSFPDGKYTPVVADRERVYLVGYARVYAMDPQ